MSETKLSDPPALGPESQKERWLKYGGNVALTTIIVVALAVAVIYATEKKSKRLDTTSAGLYSLKPQTINIIKDNPQKIQITSLYTRTKPAGKAAAEAEGETVAASVADQAEKVDDLLDEYKNKGTNIIVDSIDPDANPAKVDDLIQNVTERYGGEVNKYQAFTKTYPATLKSITTDAAAEAQKIEPLLEIMRANLEKMQASLEEETKAKKPPSAEAISAFNQLAELYNRFRQISRYLRGAPDQMQEVENVIRRAIKTKPPAYKAIADNAKDAAGELSTNLGSVVDGFTKAKDDPKLPEPARQYMTESLPRYEKLKKASDELANQAKNLGELKLDTLREALRQRNSILVRGEKEWKVISHDQVWRVDNRAAASEGAKLKPRFAGEQMITTSILALTHPQRLKVAFVRAGGSALTEPDMLPFRRGGPLSVVAERLREYNYEVFEKDLTGMSAMQRDQMAPPEPSDAEIKDAVWIVFDVPSAPTQFGAPPTISSKVAEHLANGGSALFVVTPRADDIALALKDYGITLRTDAMLVHELVKSEGEPGDMIEQVKRNPMFFEVREWGNHALTLPIQSLPGIVFNAVPVVTSSAKGVKTTPLIPIPDAPSNPKSWGKTNLDSVRNSAPTFEPDKGDLAGPLFAGAAAEKEGGSRVVVLGSVEMVANGVVDFLDPELAQRDIPVIRFPGNGEIFANSVYWLSHQDTLIATSPSAMEVSRIEHLGKGAQAFWRVGVLLIGIPMLVIVAGAMVYFVRRD